jgi:hypothetical protein
MFCHKIEIFQVFLRQGRQLQTAVRQINSLVAPQFFPGYPGLRDSNENALRFDFFDQKIRPVLFQTGRWEKYEEPGN